MAFGVVGAHVVSLTMLCPLASARPMLCGISLPTSTVGRHASSHSLSSRAFISRLIISLTLDFDSNKKVTEEVALLPSKRIRNKIAGYVTVRA